MEGAVGYAGEDDFDYDDFLAREFPAHNPASTNLKGTQLVKAAVVLIVVLAVLLLLVFRIG